MYIIFIQWSGVDGSKYYFVIDTTSVFYPYF